MIVRTVSPEEYFKSFSSPKNIFDSAEFFGTVADRVDTVRWLVGCDTDLTACLGLVVGLREGMWHAPFSAPFTSLAYNKPQSLETIYDFISEVTEFLGAPLRITVPPAFYDDEMLQRITGVFANYASRSVYDFDNYYLTTNHDTYCNTLDHSARKNLKRALSAPFEFSKTDDIARVYDTVRVNRESRGYYLAMTLEQVLRTVNRVKADAFVLSLDGEDVAAALVYHVTDSIVQVVYWGDRPGHSELRPMNLLAYRVFSYYYDHGIKIVDVGPSSKDGIPNNGLCRFKASVGCSMALKPSFFFK